MRARCTSASGQRTPERRDSNESCAGRLALRSGTRIIGAVRRVHADATPEGSVQIDRAQVEVSTTLAPPESPTREATRLSELTPRQWKSGAAAWLGWLFDGLDMHLYTLVAAPVVLQLIGAVSNADPGVKEKSAYIQAAFLLGWALGGSFFGRLGDILGRSRALSLTILTYAICTGLCAFA